MEVYNQIVNDALFKFTAQDTKMLGRIYYFDIEYWNPMGNMSLEIPQKTSGSLITLLHTDVHGKPKDVEILDSADVPDYMKKKFIDYVFNEFCEDYKGMKS